MKLKSVLNFLILTLFVKYNLAHKRSCKNDIIRSFGLHGRIVPNWLNSLCGNVKWNCCTKHDQMKIHKKWKFHYKLDLFRHYAREYFWYEKLKSKFFTRIKTMDITRMISMYLAYCKRIGESRCDYKPI